MADHWLAATILTAVALLEAWRRLRDQLPAETRYQLGLLNVDAPVRELTLAEHKALYVHGEISLHEFERRAALLVDDRTQRIQDAVEPINGIGPHTAEELANAFRSEVALRDADQDELEAVAGVGPNRARAIRERLNEDFTRNDSRS